MRWRIEDAAPESVRLAFSVPCAARGARLSLLCGLGLCGVGLVLWGVTGVWTAGLL